MAKLLLLFILLPFAELYLLLFINSHVGVWPTVAMVLVPGLFGALVARYEGLRVLRQWQRSLVRGKVPEEGVLGGVLILVGGVLLIAPGLITDLVGIVLLIPPTRRRVADLIRRRLERQIEEGTIKVVSVTHVGGQQQGIRGVDSFRPPRVVMDAEAEEINPEDDDEPRGSSDRRVLH